MSTDSQSRYVARQGVPLTAAELAEYEAIAEQEWRAEGVPEQWIALSRKNGMDAADIRAVAEFSRFPPMIIIVRCPKVTARALHRVLRRPKSLAVKVKSDSDGVARVRTLFRKEDGTTVGRDLEFTSDYDLMSVWYTEDSRNPQRLRIAPKDKPVPATKDEPWRGRFSVEAAEFVRSLNRILVARIQHGCQDDMRSIFNPGVAAHDHFTAFGSGGAKYLENAAQCAAYYRQHGLDWLYDAGGRMREDALPGSHH
jgi:hypothetical protein